MGAAWARNHCQWTSWIQLFCPVRWREFSHVGLNSAALFDLWARESAWQCSDHWCTGSHGLLNWDTERGVHSELSDPGNMFSCIPPQILFELLEAESSLCLGKAVLISTLVYNWLLTEYWLIENLETDQHLTALLWSNEKGRGTISGCKAAGLLATKSQFYPIDRWEIS